MSVYNVENYIDEAVESILNQTLDFSKHVQIIFVNDGSTDSSGKICEMYKDKFPNNIVYINKTNGGLNSARNEGLKYVKGKYINFFDPDDVLSNNTLLEVFNFFNKNFNSIDVVSIPMIYFGGRTGDHPLNFKFKKTRVININEEPDKIQLSMASSFVKIEAIKKYRFDENLTVGGDDTELLNKILQEKFAYGVISTAKYHYRRRIDNSSNTQSGHLLKEWYSQYLKNFSINTIDYSIELLGYVPLYIQNVVMYDLQWRFNISFVNNILIDDEFAEFISYLKKALSYIDDQVILKQKYINIHRKKYILELKYDKPFTQLIDYIYTNDNVCIYFKNELLCSLKNQSIYFDFIEMNKNELYIEGFFGSLFDNSAVKIFCEVNHEKIKVNTVNRETSNIYTLNSLVKEYYGFKVNIPVHLLEEKAKIKMFVEINKVTVPIEINFNRFARLSSITDKSYISLNNEYLATYDKYNCELLLEKYAYPSRLKKELGFLRSLYKMKVPNYKKVILARLFYFLCSAFLKKETWLFMDRVDKADDNAEHLYRYTKLQKVNAKIYYVIRGDVKDYSRLKKEFNIVKFGSYRHKLKHLLSSKVISSHADEWVINPFLGTLEYYQDLFNYKFIFLQHGIIKDDMSSWLNKYNKNIKLFITSSKNEYESILNNSYGYTSNEVSLSGLPRYDSLINQNEKQILIMPTWRKSIVCELNQLTGIRPYNESFKDTEYFNYYNKLINDERILTIARDKGYKLLFFPHPNIQQQIKDFHKNDYVKFVDYDVSYQELFNKSSLLVTDFSSVFFDFAYLKKPILYFHFDENHWGNGYFDYEKMGFGEVCNNYEVLVEKIVQSIKNDCIMSDKYIQRVDDFYSFTDNRNSERNLNLIKNL
ncbi:bifunctional glycosyltransferase/CDP-glycerol:glycerophosphate glycerophosphotransferase [Paenibacillus solani]|uniref:Glycosyltransferase 2-like domain-containing protein n=1 Tax=Paenibacillus solani TaxID=1705565 RepID=A0A0M1N3F3_9BACL|nr:CDP-glycerol glycerophosphotransferase family protein [Paenibacillus solani]KOR76489.1 hypothetical protein AM231_27360 [Paenibacillus solani]